MIKENVIQGRKTRDDVGIDEALSGTPGVLELTESALASNVAPDVIITQALTAGMQVVGEKFSTKEYFIPDMLPPPMPSVPPWTYSSLSLRAQL